MSKFTPGPWAHLDYRAIKMVDGFYSNVIAWTANNAKNRTPEAEANARLIAAAPDLYGALLAMTETFKPFTLKPMGGEGSPARLEQEAQIEAHKKAREILAGVE